MQLPDENVYGGILQVFQRGVCVRATGLSQNRNTTAFSIFYKILDKIFFSHKKKNISMQTNEDF